MLSLPQNPNLELLLPSSKSWAFYVHELTLTEGISQIPSANLTLYSIEFMDMDKLRTYLDMLATVKITQQHNREKISRCFSGIITNVEHLGLLQENEKGTVYGFHMTIQPILVNLCYARHNFSFKNMTPKEAIQKVLEGLPHNMDRLNEDNTPGVNTPSSFYQSQENDFQFLLRILQTYGISFSYYHPYTDDAPVSPILSLTSAGVFTVAAKLSPKVDLRSPLQFHCRKRDEENYAMTQWRLSNEIGVDAVKEDFQAANDQALSHLSGDSNSKRVVCFNTSPFGEVNKANLTRISDSFLGKMLLGRQKWEGTTASLVAMPGVLIDVLEFYGKKNDASIPAQILRSELFCRAPMPDELLQSAASMPAVFKIKLGCIDRTLPVELEASVTELQQHTTLIGGTGVLVDNTSSSQLDVLKSDDTLLLQAIVCDATGNTSSTNSLSTLSESKLKENHYTFTAKLLSGSNSSTPVDVWLVMPLGGFGQGLFRVPRQGEYILVAQNAGTNEYYLMGYLPNGNMPFASKVNYSTEIDPDTKETYTLSGSTILRFSRTAVKSKVPDYLGDDEAILSKRVSMTSGGKPLYSEIAFYTSYRPASGGKSNGKPSADNGEDTSATGNDGSTGENTGEDTAATGTGEIITDDVTVTAPDTIQVTAGSSVFLSAPSITLSGQMNGSSDGSALNISCFDKEIINANGAVVLTVGKTSVTVSQDTIALMAARWSSTQGPLTSLIALTALSGVAICGMNVMMSGSYGMTLADGSGDSIKLGTGLITKTAVVVAQKTAQRTPYIINNVLTGGYIALEIAGFITSAASPSSLSKYETVANSIKNCCTIGMQIYGAIGATQGIWKVYAQPLQIHDRNLLISQLVFNISAAILEQIVAILNSTASTWMSTPAGAVTNRDCFRLTCLILYTTGWILGVIAGSRNPRLRTAKSEVRGDEFYENMAEKDELSQIDEDDQSVMSGI